MLQWPDNKYQALQEIQRVLVPGGKVIFTSLIQPSLWQLQQAWRNIDQVEHTLNFSTLDDYHDLCAKAGLAHSHSQAWKKTYSFRNIYQLLQHFKLTGTSLPKSNAARQGLGGRHMLQQLEAAYRGEQSAANLELSYHYLMLVAHKKN